MIKNKIIKIKNADGETFIGEKKFIFWKMNFFKMEAICKNFAIKGKIFDCQV